MSLIDCNQVVDYIVNWLNDYVADTSLDGFIVGVSGGIDSAVVATLCARTKKKVILLNMPIRQTSAEYARAKRQISHLEKKFSTVRGIEINLNKPFEELKVSFPKDVQKHGLSMANTRSRLRMATLYAVGQTHNALVVGTGNKIEDFGIGFFTKYGDGGVDVQPIGDLLKSEVYQLGEYLDIIPEIINALPTDGLWDDQRDDEKQIGASYQELEKIMNSKLEELTDREKKALAIYENLHQKNKHKMAPIPICDLATLKA